MKAALPSLVTLLGLGVSLCFLSGGAWWLCPIALGCDLLDGFLARRLGVASYFGARLDWSVDTCCAAVAAAMLWWPLLGALPLCWALAETFKVKFSARAGLFIVLMIGRFFHDA